MTSLLLLALLCLGRPTDGGPAAQPQALLASPELIPPLDAGADRDRADAAEGEPVEEVEEEALPGSPPCTPDDHGPTGYLGRRRQIPFHPSAKTRDRTLRGPPLAS